LNRSLVFRSSRAHSAAAPSFFAIAAVAFVIDGVLMDAFVHRLGLHYLAAQVLTTLALLTWTFTANRLWTFREPAGRVC
jgi:putative flippase GtrA